VDRVSSRPHRTLDSTVAPRFQLSSPRTRDVCSASSAWLCAWCPPPPLVTTTLLHTQHCARSTCLRACVRACVLLPASCPASAAPAACCDRRQPAAAPTPPSPSESARRPTRPRPTRPSHTSQPTAARPPSTTQWLLGVCTPCLPCTATAAVAPTSPPSLGPGCPSLLQAPLAGHHGRYQEEDGHARHRGRHQVCLRRLLV
jgi:hypothetical protein